MRLIILIILILITSLTFSQTPRGRIQIQNGTLVTDKGTLLRGAFDDWSNNKQYINRIKDYGLNCIHLYMEGPSDEYESDLACYDSLVTWTREDSLYLIITPSWRNFAGEPNNEFIRKFWALIADRYHDETHLIFEIANEPFMSDSIRIRVQPYDSLTLTMQREVYDTIRKYAPETHVQFMSYCLTSKDYDVIRDIENLGTGIDWNNASISAHGYIFSAEDNRAFIKTVKDSGYAITITESPVIRFDDPSPDLYANRAFIRVFEQEFVSYINFMSVRDLIYKPYLFKSLIESTEIRWKPDFGSWPENLTAINYRSPYKPLLAGFCDESSVGVNYDQKFAILSQTQQMEPNGHIAFYNLDFGSGADSLLIEYFAVMSSNSKLEVHLDSLTGTLIGLCPLKPTNWDPVNGWYSDNKYSCPVKNINGIHKLFLVFKGDYGFCGIFKSIVFTKPGINAHQPPFHEIAFELPGKIEAEDYDIGTQNTSYFDNDLGNTGRQYRYDEVDIDKTGNEGYCIGWTDTGEWLEYTVRCKQETAMDIQLRVACTAPGDKIKLKLNNQVLATVYLPNTGGFWTYQTVTVENITIPAGENQVLRLELLDGSFNLDWLNFVKSSPTGIDEAKNNKTFIFYPNPAQGYIKVKSTSPVTLEIYSLQGQLLIKKKISTDDDQIPVNNLASGSYILKASNEAEIYSEILIIE